MDNIITPELFIACCAGLVFMYVFVGSWLVGRMKQIEQKQKELNSSKELLGKGMSALTGVCDKLNDQLLRVSELAADTSEQSDARERTAAETRRKVQILQEEIIKLTSRIEEGIIPLAVDSGGIDSTELGDIEQEVYGYGREIPVDEYLERMKLKEQGENDGNSN